MDQRLRRQAAERVQVAMRAKLAREQRARFLKAGGRPEARDFSTWHADDGKTLALGVVKGAPAAAPAVAQACTSRGQSSASLWVAAEVDPDDQ